MSAPPTEDDVTRSAWLRDMFERAVATYVEAFLGLLIVSAAIDLSVLRAAAISAVPATLAVVKATIASRLSPTGSASLDQALSAPLLAIEVPDPDA